MVALFDWIELHSQGIQAIFVSLSCLIALGVFIFNSISQRRIALVSMLMQREGNDQVKVASQRIRKLYADNNCSLRNFVNEDTDDRKAILMVANHYEFMAVAIRLGAFDEKTYKSLEYSNVMRNWAVLKDFIEEARTKHSNQTWFQDFEKLATKWKNAPLKAIR